MGTVSDVRIPAVVDETLRVFVTGLRQRFEPRLVSIRLYYPIYHAAIAVLLTEGVEPRSHAGTLSLLGLHVAKTGRMGAEGARLFARIQKC